KLLQSEVFGHKAKTVRTAYQSIFARAGKCSPRDFQAADDVREVQTLPATVTANALNHAQRGIRRVKICRANLHGARTGDKEFQGVFSGANSADPHDRDPHGPRHLIDHPRSEEHTSELQSR